jgi:hypothetical protein
MSHLLQNFRSAWFNILFSVKLCRFAGAGCRALIDGMTLAGKPLNKHE